MMLISDKRVKKIASLTNYYVIVITIQYKQSKIVYCYAVTILLHLMDRNIKLHLFLKSNLRVHWET